MHWNTRPYTLNTPCTAGLWTVTCHVRPVLQIILTMFKLLFPQSCFCKHGQRNAGGPDTEKLHTAHISAGNQAGVTTVERVWLLKYSGTEVAKVSLFKEQQNLQKKKIKRRELERIKTFFAIFPSFSGTHGTPARMLGSTCCGQTTGSSTTAVIKLKPSLRSYVNIRGMWRSCN